MNRNEKLLVYDFLNFVRHYKGEYTYFNEIQSWMKSDPALNKCWDLDEFKKLMRQDDYFKPWHFRKLDLAIDEFLASKK